MQNFTVEVNRKLCYIMLDYRYYGSLFLITLVVAWQLLLVVYNAKVMQLPSCNGSCKGVDDALHTWLCWEFWSK